MLPPAETNYDIVIQNSVTPNAYLAYNLGQKDLRYLNGNAEYVTCSEIGFQSGGNFIGPFPGATTSSRISPSFIILT